MPNIEMNNFDDLRDEAKEVIDKALQLKTSNQVKDYLERVSQV